MLFYVINDWIQTTFDISSHFKINETFTFIFKKTLTSCMVSHMVLYTNKRICLILLSLKLYISWSASISPGLHQGMIPWLVDYRSVYRRCHCWWTVGRSPRVFTNPVVRLAWPRNIYHILFTEVCRSTDYTKISFLVLNMGQNKAEPLNYNGTRTFLWCIWIPKCISIFYVFILSTFWIEFTFQARTQKFGIFI